MRRALRSDGDCIRLPVQVTAHWLGDVPAEALLKPTEGLYEIVISIHGKRLSHMLWFFHEENTPAGQFMFAGRSLSLQWEFSPFLTGREGAANL